MRHDVECEAPLGFVSARSPSNKSCAVITILVLLAVTGVHCGGVTASNLAPWLPLPANTVQDIADILFEGCHFRAWKSEIDEINLVLASEAVKWNSIRMCPQKLSQALLRYSAVLRFELALVLPTPNLSRRNTKEGCKGVSRKDRKPMNFVYPIIKARNLRTDGFHGVARAGRD